ncbi:YhgE/Pip domain-containing protein [Clostridium sp. 19966]|uniref:YhgE/Pip domain-containing protein n=1 Tax=Clostridium sp. 19966 TaxID=2768166 RepID=UPI0028DE95E8|nr:YhgE/Pip domain-containing protein [Clostridium sp. 19966]MDT8717437.1 YhgE/Pip domain-containing protein [Clostridium sp. 19966]
MKKIFKVYFRDLKRIKRNHAALAIVIGLSFIPSLYAWINIKACWDPYANTGNLPVAIVNKDNGAVVNGNSINVGNSIVDSLKKNKAIGWQFVDEWNGDYGLNGGKYYALIEIPENFSEGVATLTTANPQKPNIIYKSNQKANAIAAKITDAAKDKLTRQINQTFVETVNKEAIDSMNKIQNELGITKEKISGLKDILNSTNSDLSKIKDNINSASNDSKSLQDYLNNVKKNLPKITDEINSLQAVTKSNEDLINATNETLTGALNNTKTDLIQLQVLNEKVGDSINKTKGVVNSTQSKADVDKNIDDAVNLLDSTNGLIDTLIQYISNMNNLVNNDSMNIAINYLKSLQSTITQEKNMLLQIKTANDNGTTKDNINQLLSQALDLNNQISIKETQIVNNFYSNAIQAIQSTSKLLLSGTDKADKILQNLKIIVPQLNALADVGISSNDITIRQNDMLVQKIDDFKQLIDSLNKETEALNDKNLQDIVDLVKGNPDNVASFLSSPINVQEEDVYGVGTFGVGLTPFYTVLAIWVGALLCSSLLTTECDEFEDGELIGVFHGHFGKMLTFMSISLIQGLIITLGDIYILGVKPVDMRLMIIMSLLTSFTFTIIIFTLVALLGNVGKAVAVVMMVFQIAGSGGIYPIETNPKIFQFLEPLWPFKYAINGYREAIAGPIWSNVYFNVKVLLCFCGFFLLLTILKYKIHHLTEWMEHKFKEAGV